jgi:hypothetical protein
MTTQPRESQAATISPMVGLRVQMTAADAASVTVRLKGTVKKSAPASALTTVAAPIPSRLITKIHVFVVIALL